MGKIRGTHSSPGIYTQITDVEYTTRNAGITTLGLVGETLKGPAFEVIDINSWPQYVEYFGGKSAEKFKDSQYPKYELPYIAESYLKASDQLKVCRVLGLSGYNAGPAFVIKAKKDNTEYVIAVLRSRGQYKKYGMMENCVSTYDTLSYDCNFIKIVPASKLSVKYDCEGNLDNTGVTQDTTISVNTLDRGSFTIKAYSSTFEESSSLIGEYSVSLNPGAKDYILNVLGTDAQNGSAPIFLEELYDVNLEELISKNKVDEISTNVDIYRPLTYEPVSDPVADFMTIPTNNLSKKHVGISFVYAKKYKGSEFDETQEKVWKYDGTSSSEMAEGAVEEGGIYVVKSYFKENVKKYGYFAVLDKTGQDVYRNTVIGDYPTQTAKTISVSCVKVLAYDNFAVKGENGGSEKLVDIISNNFNDYREQYRFASTPWVVSEIKGNAKHYDVKKLFRFHTITDGNAANTQVKISIANIRPDEGTFDVYVRDFYDTDSNPTILESYKGLTMVPGTSKYIGLKIGTIDGTYETVSKYVLVEVIENEETENCVPCGFLGYPIRKYSSGEAPYFTYNRIYDEDIREKKQYFGLSDITGVDEDMLSYKGKQAYNEEYEVGYTTAFHLDSRLNNDLRTHINGGQQIVDVVATVDGEYPNITWAAVLPSNVTSEQIPPVIAGEEEMSGTIYEDIRLRKFTVYPYGGFDGWDVYRSSRTNTDEYKASKYKGSIINGQGSAFSTITDGTGLSLSGRCISSDYYAYLAGINQFQNPEKEEINLFATPGIDYVNNELLVNDAIDVIENRLDTFYVITTPDKPWGASDAADEMYSSQDAAENLDDTNIDTYYASSYYPWVKYFDESNSIYIHLPATKDAVRIMANTDNKRYPWIAPAGFERGTVECKKMRFFATLEDRDNVYDSRINPLMSFKEGVKIWGNKTLYISDETNPMNRINSVRLMLYMRKLIVASCIGLIFEPEDETLKEEFEGIIKPILAQIKEDRGITDWDLIVSQTEEQMDAHELSATIFIKPTPTLEAIEINFVVTPQGVKFLDAA